MLSLLSSIVFGELVFVAISSALASSSPPGFALFSRFLLVAVILVSRGEVASFLVFSLIIFGLFDFIRREKERMNEKKIKEKKEERKVIYLEASLWKELTTLTH